MNKLNKRQSIFEKTSSKLACLSNKKLEKVLSEGKVMHKGMGGTSLQIEVDNITIFVKKVPITDLELQSENYMATSNIFNLPMCYQYGIGSAGFGAWRELAVHIMTTNWVITNRCSHFPIMYHWRLIKDIDQKTISDEEQVTLDKDTTYWENNPEINKRLKAKALACHHLCFFLEFIPSQLYDWLNQQLALNNESAINAIKFVERQIQETTNFMRNQNFLHMDAHFENILTDGEELYYTDFGLALSDKFELTNIEKKFMQDNLSYDYASGTINLLHSIITGFWGKKATLEDYHNNKLQLLNTQIDAIILKQMPISLIMEKFYRSIQKNKAYPYPSKDVKSLIYKS